MKTCMKNSKGITLIALIVTTIVLALTISISIKLIAGSNGIIAKASKAADANEKAQIKEDIELTLAEMKADYYISEERTTYGTFENYWKAQLPITTKRGGRLIKEMGPDGEESLITYITKKGTQYDISTEENIVTGPLTGSEEDDIPPTIGTPDVGTTTLSVLLIDARGSGVASYMVKDENVAPAEDDEGWNVLPEVSTSYRLNLTGLTVKTTYYIFAKDASGNISEGREATTKDIDAANSTNLTVQSTTWDGINATVTFTTTTEYNIELTTTPENENSWSTENSITVPSGTEIYARLVDDYGNPGTYYSASTPILTYTIEFDSNGGTGTMTNLSDCAYGTSYTLTANTFSHTELGFNGWNTESDGNGTSYSDEASVSNLTTTNGEKVTLYAQWKVISYTKCYADFEGDGTVDGIIYADLLAEAGTSGVGCGFSYNIPDTVNSTNVKKYIIKGSYTDSHFGTNNVIEPVSGTIGEDRFYVMQLTDSGSGKWIGGTGTEFGIGKSNCGVSGSGQWFRPSKGEWAKFVNNLGITGKSEYGTYGLSRNYWTSSMQSYGHCWMMYLDYLYFTDAFGGNEVSTALRMSATF